MSEWKPIEMAPLMPMPLILFGKVDGRLSVKVGHYHPFMKRWFLDRLDLEDGCEIPITPTHWMFLPEPPENPEGSPALHQISRLETAISKLKAGLTASKDAEMTLEEQREKLIEMMCKARYEHGLVDNECVGKWETVARTFKEMWRARESAVLAALSAAGFSIVGRGVTEDMADAGWEKMREIENRDGSFPSHACLDIWRAMLATGDLARKPE